MRLSKLKTKFQNNPPKLRYLIEQKAIIENFKTSDYHGINVTDLWSDKMYQTVLKSTEIRDYIRRQHNGKYFENECKNFEGNRKQSLGSGHRKNVYSISVISDTEDSQGKSVQGGELQGGVQESYLKAFKMPERDLPMKIFDKYVLKNLKRKATLAGPFHNAENSMGGCKSCDKLNCSSNLGLGKRRLRQIKTPSFGNQPCGNRSQHMSPPPLGKSANSFYKRLSLATAANLKPSQKKPERSLILSPPQKLDLITPISTIFTGQLFSNLPQVPALVQNINSNLFTHVIRPAFPNQDTRFPQNTKQKNHPKRIDTNYSVASKNPEQRVRSLSLGFFMKVKFLLSDTKFQKTIVENVELRKKMINLVNNTTFEDPSYNCPRNRRKSIEAKQ